MHSVKPLVYWTDFILSLLVFGIGFFVFVVTGNLIGYLVAAIFLYRACAFTHEIAHQYKNTRLQSFKLVWNLTAGFLMMQPALRFTKPHLIHHKTGVFATKEDPQYPLIRSDIKYGLFVMVLSAWLFPIHNILICMGIPGIDKILYEKIQFTSNEYKYLRQIEKLYLYFFVALCFMVPNLILPFYLVSVGSWFLSVLRIPLEHSLKEYKETSDYNDQRLDSYTHRSPLWIPIQPLALRYHTIHHMYPKVPYHNIPILHKQLELEEF